MAAKPKLAVWKFASCDGCQLSILDCEDELLALAGAVTIANFPEASRAVVKGPYDLSLVEGSVTTAHDLARIQQIRRGSKMLIAIGACATAGGIQALRNYARVQDYVRTVYAHPEYIETLNRSTPIAEHVTVDLELRGCPISKEQLLETVAAVLAGRKPNLPAHAVCIDCKLAGHHCVLVSQGTACLGPVTHSGCGALCPSFNRGCFGCFGPAESANTAALAARLAQDGRSSMELLRLFRGFSAGAAAFDREGRAHDHD